MLMICWIASSWPTMRLRSSPSSFSASSPVCAGFSCLFSRPMSVPFLPSLSWIEQLEGADHRPRGHLQYECNRFGNIFGRNRPTGVAGARLPWVGRKLRIHAARHNAAYTHIVVAMIQHHGLAEAVEPEFRSVVRRAAAEGVLARKARNIDDEPAAAPGKTLQRFVRAVESAVEIDIDVLMPFLGCHLRHLFVSRPTGIVDQDVEPVELPVDGFEKGGHLFHAADIRRVSKNPPQ